MERLKKMIMEKGETRGGDILKVDSFLNHQIDADLLYDMGEAFYEHFKDAGITKILTIEVSGIAIAMMAALFFKVPVVFAKKTESLNLDKEVYTGKVYSYTKNRTYDIMVSKKYLSEGDRLLIVDDFLADGNAMKGLLDVVEKSGATVGGIGIAIEKGFQPGGVYLREKGYELQSLAIVDDLSGGVIRFREV